MWCGQGVDEEREWRVMALECQDQQEEQAVGFEGTWASRGMVLPLDREEGGGG
jgi:hypothetical protein